MMLSNLLIQVYLSNVRFDSPTKYNSYTQIYFIDTVQIKSYMESCITKLNRAFVLKIAYNFGMVDGNTKHLGVLKSNESNYVFERKRWSW